MGNKKIIRTVDITEKDILSLYEGVLPLLYDNPEKINPANVLKKNLQKLIPYDFRIYAMEDPKLPLTAQRRSANFQIPDQTGIAEVFMSASKKKNIDISFEEMVEVIYRKAIKVQQETFPQKIHQYHYHEIRSKSFPKITLGFFRYKHPSRDNSFGADDLQKFALLKPHLFLLYRTIINDALRSPTLQYYTVFNNICAEIAENYKLSDTEYKIIPEILFGLNNEEIAVKNFVSVGAIKKHIKHIFKKTSTKNRIDFISKFFTSPDRINL